MTKIYGNYDKYPELTVPGYTASEGYAEITDTLRRAASGKDRFVIALDCYTEVNEREVENGLAPLGAVWYHAGDAMITDAEYSAKISGFLTNDRVFGVMNTLTLGDIIDETKLRDIRGCIERERGIVCVIGVGAALVADCDLIVYLDLARWEIECRFAAGAPNWKSDNKDAPKLAKFKQGYFVEWRIADRYKRSLLGKADFLLDTNEADKPKMVSGNGFRAGLSLFASRPFRLVPYFAPEVWGGQWMKDVCSLDRSAPNYAWAFDGVPEENSIFMRFGKVRIEIPSIDIVFYEPEKLLGERVYGRFGDEYPIRFDFLDTMSGQNLSLQVHPTTEYIQSTFGMHYTQDESYYILDCEDGASVRLGVKNGIDRQAMLDDLRAAQRGEKEFPADKYINKWQAKKHDHFLIPAGTVHCSGAGTMVLEVSATPYIFTFKLWDWARVGLDGLPRPVHLSHGEKVIKWERDTDYVKANLINRFEVIGQSDSFTEERTGLHEREFIETRRYTICKKTQLRTDGSVCQLNVVDGAGAIIESPDKAFDPFEVHYAETFIIPECVKQYTVRPLGESVVILKASVR